MNYLPSNIDSDSIFRENPWTKLFRFDESFLSGKEIRVEIWGGNTIISVIPETNINGPDFNFYLNIGQVRSLPSSFVYYIIFNDVYLLGGKVYILTGTGSQSTGVTSVVIQEGDVTTVQIDGVEAVSELVAKVQQDAASVASDKQDVAADRVAVEGIRDEVVGGYDITVNTYEEAVTYFTGNVKRTIFISQASQYNELGEFFTWFPEVQKAAYLGIDLNYTD